MPRNASMRVHPKRLHTSAQAPARWVEANEREHAFRVPQETLLQTTLLAIRLNDRRQTPQVDEALCLILIVIRLAKRHQILGIQ